MSDIKICDKCNKPIYYGNTYTVMKPYKVDGIHTVQLKGYDLCKDCWESIKHSIEGKHEL